MKRTAFGILLLCASSVFAQNRYIAHEWGTFTSVQGSDGAPLIWQPLESSHLPGFVYDWKRPGFGRTMQQLGKGTMFTIQRMETPVIYFYSDNELAVDVTVKFPMGTITEWYPQATRIGPTGFLPDKYTVPDSRIEWSGLKILPARQNADAARLIPFDESGSHYFAARDTDSELVRADFVSTTNISSETEKFLFYRGVGNFTAPLRVTMQSDDQLTLTNSGTEALPHLFVFRLHEGKGQLIYLAGLNPGAEQAVQLRNDEYTIEELSAQLEQGMTVALTSQGLYPREASAMVNTWKDSWFAEEGLRVLYVLPRAWTDNILPLELNPKPTELVRVMVGRAEMISPGLEAQIRDGLTKAMAGDEESHVRVKAQLTKLGRFAQPAIQRATKGISDQQIGQFGYKLLKPPAEPSSSAL